MSDEFDIVEQLLGNEKPKKSVKLDVDKDIPDEEDIDLTESGEGNVTGLIQKVKHLDPLIKGKDASCEKKDKEHWPGDCVPISKEDIIRACLPKDAYLYVKYINGPNYSACVYDPVHWIYGWGNSTMEAKKDCIDNIVAWRKEYPDKIDNLIKGWEERVRKYAHPMRVHSNSSDDGSTKTLKKLASKPLVEKNTSDILSDLGL